MKTALESFKDLRFTAEIVKIKAALNQDSAAQLEALAQELASAE
jgi:hypothetical protein